MWCRLCLPQSRIRQRFRRHDGGWPPARLLARALVVLDENGTVVHTELVPELACEADYDGALDIIHNHHQPCLDDAMLTSE